MMDPWYYLSCAGCKARLRIKSEYTSMQGRCPSCGMRIEPPHPKPLAFKLTGDNDEPGGLVPEDPEWPEPATLIDELESAATPTYQFSESASVPEVEKDDLQEGGIYSLAFDPDAPKTAGISRSTEWDQGRPPTAPTKENLTLLEPIASQKTDLDVPGKAETPQDTTPFKMAEPPPHYETLVDPLFGDVVKIPKPNDAKTESTSNTTPSATGSSSASADSTLAPSASQAKPVPPPPLAKFAPEPDVTKNWGGEEEAPAVQIKNRDKSERPAKEPAQQAPVGDAPLAGSLDTPTKDTHLFQLSDAERNPGKADPPPSILFFEGVWNFPWRPGNWGVWIWLAVGFTMISLVAWFMEYLVETAGQSGPILAGAMGIFAFFITVYTMLYANIRMLVTIGETSQGLEVVTWPQDALRDTFLPALRVTYYYSVALILAFVALGFTGIIYFWLALSLFLFPAIIFGGLASTSPFNFVHAGVLKMIGKKIHLYLMAFGLSLALMGVAGAIFILATKYLILVPVAGMVIAAAWLIYSRLLGRLAWALQESQVKKKRKKKKKKKVEEHGDNTAEEPEDESSPEDQAEQVAPSTQKPA